MIKLTNPRLRAYAAPLLSQEEGIDTLSTEASQGFECLYYYRDLYPDHKNWLSSISNIIRQARRIYLKRALAGPEAPPFTDLVEQFKCTLESIPSGALGEHVLVWSTFLAASESSMPEHRQFFSEVLLKHHRRNGFLNIPAAMKNLQHIWARQGCVSWTTLLPAFRIFIM